MARIKGLVRSFFLLGLVSSAVSFCGLEASSSESSDQLSILGPRYGLGGKGGSGVPDFPCESEPYTTESTNTYFPMTVGDQWYYEANDHGTVTARLVTVLDETRVISGVETRVIEAREYSGPSEELIQVSWKYFAQEDEDPECPECFNEGTICYYGDDIDRFTDDEISHEGSWCADHGASVLFMPPDKPRPGTKFSSDTDRFRNFQIIGGGPVRVPFGRFTETLRWRETSEGNGETRTKTFAPSIGLLEDGELALVSFTQDAQAPDGPIPTAHLLSCAVEE